MIYDINTKNKSFIRVAKQLKELGVKNHKFMLLLCDPELSGVDPHSPDLTERQKVKIIIEARKNVWYYLRELVRIPAPGNAKGIAYGAHLGNMAISFAKFYNLNFVALLPRQQGKTIANIVYDTWIMCFGSNNCQMIYMNKQFPDSKENLKRFKDIRRLLPKYLLETVETKLDQDNKEYKSIARLNNTMLAKPAANSVERADLLGRGLTCPILFFDEFAFLKHNDIIYAAAAPAWKTASMVAKAAKVPYGISITTTPNNIDVAAGEYCKSKIIDKATPFDFCLYDMSYAQIIDYMEQNGSVNFLYITYQYQQLGKDDIWFEQMKKDLLHNTLKIKREVLLEWTKSSDNSVFNEDELDTLASFVKTKTGRLNVMENFYIDLYEDLDPNINYVLSCDVSGGTGSDNSVMKVIHPSDFHVTASFSNAKIDIEKFKQFLVMVMRVILPKSVIVIERNSYGKAILDFMVTLSDIEPRMYRNKVTRPSEKKLDSGVVIKENVDKVIYGVDTTNKSRPIMIDILTQIVRTAPEFCTCPELFSDIKNLEYMTNEKVAAGNGKHDDNVMAYLVFRYALTEGRCFRDRFGISPQAAKSNVRDTRNGIKASSQVLSKVIQSANNAAGSTLFSDLSATAQELLAQANRGGGVYDPRNEEERRKQNSDAALLNAMFF